MIHVRRVRIALLVGVHVVLAVVGDPADDRPLDRHRAERGEDRAHGLARLERAVREQAMKADRDPQPGQHVHDREHDQIAPAEQLRPHLPGDDAEGEDRHDGDRRRSGTGRGFRWRRAGRRRAQSRWRPSAQVSHVTASSRQPLRWNLHEAACRELSLAVARAPTLGEGCARPEQPGVYARVAGQRRCASADLAASDPPRVDLSLRREAAAAASRSFGLPFLRDRGAAFFFFLGSLMRIVRSSTPAGPLGPRASIRRR